MVFRRGLLGIVLACACVGSTPVELGTYRVTATRRSATCGPQSNAYLPRVVFDVNLQLVGQGTLDWAPVGASSSRGIWNPLSQAFRVFQEEDIVAWAPDRRREIVGCVLRRSDVIEGVVEQGDGGVGGGGVGDGGVGDGGVGDGGVGDGGVNDGGANDGGANDGGASPARSFTATETITYGVSAGDCRAILGAGEGQFTQLPCEVTYTFEAVRR